MAEDLDKWEGFYNAYARTIGTLDRDEPWRVWHATKGEFPTDDDIAHLDGFVMSGSHYSAYEDLPWIHSNLEFIRKAYAAAEASKKAAAAAAERGDTPTPVHPKLVGICFGCQAAATALGGVVDKNGIEDFTLKSEGLSLTDVAAAKPYMAPMVEHAKAAAAAAAGDETKAGEDEPAIYLLQSHGDRVHKLPEGSEVVATSKTAPLEMWELNDIVLSVQGHPEFETSTLMTNIFPTIQERLCWDEVESERRRVEAERPHTHDAIRATLRQFLTGGAEWAVDA